MPAMRGKERYPVIGGPDRVHLEVVIGYSAVVHVVVVLTTASSWWSTTSFLLTGAVPAILGISRRSAKNATRGSRPGSLIFLPTGCPFHPRCPYADGDLCVNVVPEPQALADGHRSACYYAATLDERVARA